MLKVAFFSFLVGGGAGGCRYDLELWTVPGPIHDGLTRVLQEHPDIKAILMGTRRSDPHAANLEAFQV